MEQALDDFQSLMAGRDTALFYYAGHGLQVGGENFLVPVREEIRTEAQAKSRSVSLGATVGPATCTVAVNSSLASRPAETATMTASSSTPAPACTVPAAVRSV